MKKEPRSLIVKTVSREQRNDMLLNQPVNKAIPRLAIPTIFTMLITTIYNMADTFFVSQIGTSASGAVGVIFSAMSIIQAIAFTIGMGSGANLSRCLGAGQEEEGRRYVSVGFFTAFGVGIVIAVLGLSCIDPLVRFLGATDTIAPYARDYATYIFYATPFQMCSFVLNNFLRFEGMATYGMIGMVVGGVLNMILDPILIFGCGMGTAGAAVATAISQVVSFCILLYMTNHRSDAISIRLKNFRPTLRMYGRILYTGLPSLGRQGIASVSNILLNITAGVHGDAAIAAMSIVGRCVMFINSSVIGFGQGFQPVCAFSYGAGRYTRVREAFWYCVKVTTCILVVLGVLALIFAEPVVTVFRRNDSDVINIGTLALRLQLITVPLWGFIVMSNMFTQSIGYGFSATVISVARQGLFLIPALLILPHVLGLLGIQCAQPVADSFAFVLAWLVVRGVLKRLKTMPDKA
ncbi:MAG: MATE family efflux transporter [Clostridiales bacterium]|nr:MATE family efflux transporter [Clostridiales bacterium]